MVAPRSRGGVLARSGCDLIDTSRVVGPALTGLWAGSGRVWGREFDWSWRVGRCGGVSGGSGWAVQTTAPTPPNLVTTTLRQTRYGSDFDGVRPASRSRGATHIVAVTPKRTGTIHYEWVSVIAIIWSIFALGVGGADVILQLERMPFI